MGRNILPVCLLNVLVNFLLLSGVGKLSGYPVGWKRLLIAAIIRGGYAGACLIPGFAFLGNSAWRIIFLWIVSSAAYGWNRRSMRGHGLFMLFSLALEGALLGQGKLGIFSWICIAGAIFVVCRTVALSNSPYAKFVPVIMSHGDKILRFTALRDTGNALRDPITGKSVLIVGAEIANQLTGLTPYQLSVPSDAIMASGIPGLRLIPYRTVGQTSGLMLGMRMKNVTIGTWTGSALVAFAPHTLSVEGKYQALTGGAA